MVNSAKGNMTLEKTIYYAALIVLCNFLSSKAFKDKLYRITIKDLKDHYINMSNRNIELKEIDELGIEFKAGVRIKGGLFDPSPKKFSKKLLDKLKGEKRDIIIFFIGINEDTRDFSPIPLHMIRNEFHNGVVKCLSNSCTVLLSETVPITESEGILIIGLQKTQQ